MSGSHGFDARLRDFMLAIPNLPHSSVPVGADAHGERRSAPLGRASEIRFRSEAALGSWRASGILDLPRAAKMSGARMALYRGVGARLERALANFFLDAARPERLHGISCRRFSSTPHL